MCSDELNSKLNTVQWTSRDFERFFKNQSGIPNNYHALIVKIGMGIALQIQHFLGEKVTKNENICPIKNYEMQKMNFKPYQNS